MNRLLLLLLLFLASASAVQAGWFTDASAPVRRREEKIAVLSPQRSTALRTLCAERDAREAEIAVLKRLSAEKAAAASSIAARFSGEYGIHPDRNYTYDPESLTIYLLSPDPRHGGSAQAPARLPHRVFPTEGEAQQFRSLMAAKDAALAAKSVFDATLAEKQAALRDTLGRMQVDFNLDPLKSYRLDPDMRSVWVELPPPEEPPMLSPEEVAARKAAAAEAERKAREEAKERSRRLREEQKRLAEERAKFTAEEEEAERLRQEALKRVEKELAELDAREAARAKAAAKAKEEADRRAAEEKARADKAAKEKAERDRRAKEEADRKAAEEKARADKAAKEKAERDRRAKEEADRRAAEEKARAAEESALAEAVKAETSKRAEAVEKARRAVSEAEEICAFAQKKFEEARSRRDEARNMANTSDVLLERLAEAQKNEERKLDAARDVVRNARRALSDAEDALSNAEKEARRAFYDSIRASGREPLTEPRGFFSWF